MTAVDWNAFRKCPVCGQPIGKPCAGIQLTPIDRPHGSRQPRTGGA